MAEVVIANFAPIFSYFELFLTNVAPSTKYERFSYLLYPLETAFPPQNAANLIYIGLQYWCYLLLM